MRAVRTLGKAVLAGAVVAVLASVALTTVLPRAVRGAALTVLTGSMTPTIPVGSVVIVRPVDPGTLRAGDVVTYQKAPGQAVYITHRIVAVDATTEPATLTTKGDANRGVDIEPVPVGAVRGKVWFHVPYLGTVRNAISAGPLALAAAVLALAGYALAQVRSAFLERRATAPQSSAATGLQPPAAPAPQLPEPAASAALTALVASPELLSELGRLLEQANELRAAQTPATPQLWLPPTVRRDVARVPGSEPTPARRLPPAPALAAASTFVLALISGGGRRG